MPKRRPAREPQADFRRGGRLESGTRAGRDETMNESPPDRTLPTRRAVLRGAAGARRARLRRTAARAASAPRTGRRRRPARGSCCSARAAGPASTVDRSETASAVVVDGVPYLVDCGYGTMRALVASGLGFQPVSTVFLTHLHDDHTADLAAMLAHQWTGSKATPTHVYGPYAHRAHRRRRARVLPRQRRDPHGRRRPHDAARRRCSSATTSTSATSPCACSPTSRSSSRPRRTRTIPSASSRKCGTARSATASRRARARSASRATRRTPRTS